MSPEQAQHIQDIIKLAAELLGPKYEAGAIEHKTGLWTLSDEQLEIEELNEMLDLIVYRMARILKRRNMQPS